MEDPALLYLSWWLVKIEVAFGLEEARFLIWKKLPSDESLFFSSLEVGDCGEMDLI